MAKTQHCFSTWVWIMVRYNFCSFVGVLDVYSLYYYRGEREKCMYSYVFSLLLSIKQYATVDLLLYTLFWSVIMWCCRACCARFVSKAVGGLHTVLHSMGRSLVCLSVCSWLITYQRKDGRSAASRVVAILIFVRQDKIEPWPLRRFWKRLVATTPRNGDIKTLKPC